MTASTIKNTLKMCLRFTNPCSLKLEPPIPSHSRREYISSAPSESYDILTITENDREQILNFLYKTYFKDEPLMQSLNVMETETYRNTDVDNFSMRYDSSLSLKAVSSAGQVIGCSLNDVTKKAEIKKETSPHPKMQKIGDLYNEIAEKANIFGKYPDVDKILFIRLVSVDPPWGEKGVGRKLLASTVDIGRKNGFKIVAGYCTGKYSARVAVKQGFENIYTLKYADYKVNGEVVFHPQKPHVEIGVYIIKLG